MLIWTADSEEEKPKLIGKNIVCFDYWTREDIEEAVEREHDLPERVTKDIVEQICKKIENCSFPDYDDIDYWVNQYVEEYENSEDCDEDADEEDEDEN